MILCKSDNPDYPGGANKLSLNQAREQWLTRKKQSQGPSDLSAKVRPSLAVRSFSDMLVQREKIITSLLEFESSLEVLRNTLSRFDWDSETLARCLPRHVQRVLERYLAGEISVSDVEAWANLVEGRDDIELAENVRPVIFELANPAIAQPLSPQRAHVLLCLLKGKP